MILKQEVDVYCQTGSKIPDRINKCIDKNDNGYKFNIIDMTKNKGSRKKNSNDLVIFEEEDSYLSCVDIYDKIVSKYEKHPVVIVISTNKEIFNVVRWIRKGACDYILLGELKKDVLYNSLKGSYNYSHSLNEYEKAVKSKSPVPNHRVIIPTDFNWTSLKDGENYEMTLVKISILFNKDYMGRYSKASVEKIYEQIKSEVSIIAQNFSGRVWFWQNNSGVLVFHFGDMNGCAALASIYFYNRFFLMCIEKLKLDEILKFKVTVHGGNCYYHRVNTDQITSDVINSLVHIEKNITKEDRLTISEPVYKKLSPRLTKHFCKLAVFNNQGIYDLNI